MKTLSARELQVQDLKWLKHLQPLQEVEQAQQLAWKELMQLCQTGGRSFRMCVPRDSSDSDAVIAAALHQIPLLIAELRAAWQAKRDAEQAAEDYAHIETWPPAHSPIDSPTASPLDSNKPV